MDYIISSDKNRIDTDAVHDYLCHRSYWAAGRSLERVRKSIEHSDCFGLYNAEGAIMAFARVLSDRVVFAYLMDFFVFEEYRGKGLGKALLKHIISQADFQVRLWFLATANAHGLYEQFGFRRVDDPDRYMYRRDDSIC